MDKKQVWIRAVEILNDSADEGQESALKEDYGSREGYRTFAILSPEAPVLVGAAVALAAVEGLVDRTGELYPGDHLSLGDVEGVVPRITAQFGLKQRVFY